MLELHDSRTEWVTTGGWATRKSQLNNHKHQPDPMNIPLDLVCICHCLAQSRSKDWVLLLWWFWYLVRVRFFYSLYLWLIAVALIVSSHYSTKAHVSKLTGRNAVQVLATPPYFTFTVASWPFFLCNSATQPNETSCLRTCWFNLILNEIVHEWHQQITRGDKEDVLVTQNYDEL